jgi:hypothetical protein
MAHWVQEAAMGIGERVREAHLRHFCPGGAGFPVTSPTSAGVDLEQAPFVRQPHVALDDHMARASGEPCGRCEQAIEARQAVRRRAGGLWVHENCPPLGP